MRVFVTGATGFVGSAILPKLLAAGHQVLALARSEASAAALTDAGAEVHRGDLHDLQALRAGAAGADGVIHAAFDHDFSKFVENSEADRRAIEAMGEAVAGSDRPLIITSGLPLVQGRAATEEDGATGGRSPRTSEQVAMALADRGVRAAVVRMSQVHDRDKQGLATYMVAVARDKGVSAYIGSGVNRWPAVHRLDAGAIYLLALEKAVAGARYHAVDEEGVAMQGIAEAIGQGLNMPVVSLSQERAPDHFGWLAMPVGMDAPATSALTRERLSWAPEQEAGFLADLTRSRLFES